MNIKLIEQDGFEEIAICNDPSSGLKAIIAIHSTRSGPALGGIRMYPYSDETEALKDVMRLAKAMSYKSAAAHLKLGGGKAVVIGKPNSDKTPQLLNAMGKFIDYLKGRYYSAKDVGITASDLAEIGKETRYVVGLPESIGGSGDPSPWTAKGVLEGMRACLKEKLNQDYFKGVVVAIQGLGHVGFSLAKLLHKEKAKLIVADVNQKIVERIVRELNAETVSTDEIFHTTCDIFAPCAMGGAVNDNTVPQLQCKIIAGCANNQLENQTIHGAELFRRGILYAPDYIINAGGVINIYVRDFLKEKDSMPWVKKIEGHLYKIFTLSKHKGVPTSQIANDLTEEILSEKAKK